MPHRILSVVAPSIRGRLTVLIMAILLPAALLTAWLIWQVFHNERSARERHLADTAEAFCALIDVELRERLAVLQGLASSSALGPGDWREFRARAQRVLEGRSDWVILSDADHRQLVNTSLPEDAALPTMTHVADADDWFAARGIYVSNLVRSDATKRLILHVSKRVELGGKPAMLTLAMLPEDFTRPVLSHQISAGWVITVLDREKTVAARSRSPEQFVGVKATHHIQRALEKGSSGVVESVTLEGVKSLAAFHRSDESGWTVVVGSPRAELLAPARRAMWLALLAAAVVCAVAIPTALWLRRTTVAAVQTLVADTEALAHGQPVAKRRTGIQEGDEVSAALAATSQELAARQAALAKARDEALAASRTKDEFLAALSHELRTPLNPVLLLASEAARDEGYPPAVREIFSMIERNVMTETRLIDDLLDVTRIAAGKISLRLEQVEVDRVVQDAWESLRARADQKRLDVRVRLGATGATVRGDAVRLLQVFANVLGNAVKFTPEGGIVMMTTRADAGARRVKIEIADSGIGMNAEEIARVFERFVQGEHASHGRGSRYGGLGLGLSISRSLVEMHGGRIEATSAGAGRGSTFTILLPMEAAG